MVTRYTVNIAASSDVKRNNLKCSVYLVTLGLLPVPTPSLNPFSRYPFPFQPPLRLLPPSPAVFFVALKPSSKLSNEFAFDLIAEASGWEKISGTKSRPGFKKGNWFRGGKFGAVIAGAEVFDVNYPPRDRRLEAWDYEKTLVDDNPWL